ncbi:MAG: FAD-dependent oxidoreductase, partial [Cyclobacteriaceae bacterium]
ESLDFPVSVHSDRATGHLVFESSNFPSGISQSVETLIVGGGIAGLSAATSLPHNDVMLCELSDRLGGTSASLQYNGLSLAQGAHYDLEYPANYGESVLNLLEKLDIINFEQWKNSWRFTDKQYIIPHESKNQCFDHGAIRSDVLREGKLRNDFLSLMQRYAGKMPMPTRLINKSLQDLDQVTFVDFLRNHLALTPDFIRGLDYHMLDDWGGTASQVSAIAGIHYFQCRPYYKEINQLFSPPQGNDYFVTKLAERLPEGQKLTGKLVKRILKKDKYWEASVIDVRKREVTTVRAANVIYAGQKHALKYVMPEYAQHFAENQYAPWMVLNFVLSKPFETYGFWQNEMLVDDITFLGFINSASQYSKLQPKQVLTAYYCLPSSSRKYLANVEKQKEQIVRKTLDYLSSYFGENIDNRVEAAFINAMGHAMPIPVPGHLFGNKNIYTAKDGLAFAGVDHHRLPLLFEAIDSGIEAVNALYRKSS